MVDVQLMVMITDGTTGYAKYVWPGGYPLYAIMEDGEPMCIDCANENLALDPHNNNTDKQWHVVAIDTNWEDDDLTCSNCYEQIESAYGEDNN